ncbi:ATP-binding protein [Accumulibacter sp.]|uniref:sensor histidine kinase n=1 Tax=Accumulibacter sp. TaxID=2053492 RepID=UPI00261EF313|nr:ATP-binding protein [Accumulibacter sp.]
MIRSNFAITRLIALPYAVLLALYLAVVGGGGAWLYHQVRAVETRLLVDEILRSIEPLAEVLRSVDAIAAMRDSEPWLVSNVEALFAGMPALRNVSVREAASGYRMENNAAGAVSLLATSPLPGGAVQASAHDHPDQRLHDSSDLLFLISFDINPPASALVTLDFAFDRAMLLARINESLIAVKRSIQLFGIAGALSILVALFITGVAMRTTRRLESHFQEIYQRASLTETAAQLVHDLRNPLAALRANVKALLVSPEQTKEIVAELDRDIVTLNDKLSAFLNLTRQRDEALAPVDVGELIHDAVRLAEPALAKQGLIVQTDIAANLPWPSWQEASLRDALLNLILNASQSGQREGSIRVTAQAKDRALEIAVEDRGRGIPKEQMPRLFDAFYTTRAGGNGLGLAIVRRIVSEHQGRIHVENRLDGGARFVLTLPLQRKEIPHWWSRLKKPSPV